MSDQGRRVAAGAIIAAGASLGVVGTAAAATVPASVSVNQPCYILTKTRPTMVVTGSGFPAGDSVTIEDTTGLFIETVTASPTGTITASAPAPYHTFLKPGELKDTVTATDQSIDGNTYQGSTTTELSVLGAYAKTRKGHGLKPLTYKTTWQFSGFPEGKPIYGHYLYGKKLVARQRFGRAKGACGLLTVRRRLYPATPHHRTYRLQLDTRAKYSVHASPRLVSKVGLQVF